MDQDNSGEDRKSGLERLVPRRQVRHETEVRRSRFIATVGPVFTVEEAKDFVERMRREFPDATHNVPAYLIGHGPSVIAHCNDDGEPSGTAGRPMLAVLKGSGLGDVAAVVTRYFGGVKLGTGGLVRAYSEALRQALDRLPLACKLATHTVRAIIPYPLYQPLKQLLEEYEAEILGEDFSDTVTVTLRVQASLFDPFQRRLADLSGGSVSAEVLSTDPATKVPLPKVRSKRL
ncbi:MAG TPA: YigZ family protein [Acidobacteriota bacterium]|nr:YigZ family protein [Acidobacteriota bacterium]